MSTSSSSELEDLPETPDTTGAYPRLSDEQVMLLSLYGERKALTKGTIPGPKPILVLGAALATAANAWLTQLSAASAYASSLVGPMILLGTPLVA